MSPAAPDILQRDYSSKELIGRLNALHADEFVDLRKKAPLFVKKSDQSWAIRSLIMVKQYFVFILATWKRVLWMFLFYPTTIMDRISLVIISFCLVVILTIFLPWCIFSSVPSVVQRFDNMSKRLFGGLGIVNASYPTMFTELTQKELEVAKKRLREDIKQTKNNTHKRYFDLDASKLLLQCAALMYERTSHSPLHSASVASEHASLHVPQHPLEDLSSPTIGQRISEICGEDGARAVDASLHSNSLEERNMARIAHDHLGLMYTTISDMNSLGAAFCGLFWDPEDNYIIVSFRGTNPVDYTEWLTDFSANMREAGQWLSDFGKVHEGFMTKLFPSRITPGSKMPYVTINESIRLLSEELRRKKGHQFINIWVTGHSLGCALASLSYARMVCEPMELGSDVVLRDAYLFAAPVCCDAASSAAFNNKLNHKFPHHPRTMWRVTNGDDVVATGLPDYGDNVDWTLGPYNMLAFAHLGCEIKMRPYPKRCIVRGHHITPGTEVLVYSELGLSGVSRSTSNSRPEYTRAGSSSMSNESTKSEFVMGLEGRIDSDRYKLMIGAQNMFGLGRIIAHGTGFYWNSLQAVGTGRCEWVEGDE